MELLSPAGSFDCLKAAVSAGCDAVYMGSSEFANARMNAENFNNASLSEAIEYCKVRDVKSYITINTLLTDREISQLFDYAVFLYQSGADAVIIQDLGVVSFLRKNIPELTLHASTQMGICSLDGVNFAESMGFERAVLARELSEKNMQYICKNTRLETEVFVHGAMCACCSGYCLMSSFIGRRSGNRGKCAQPCRLSYEIGGKSGHYMNLKDMMLINHINSLKNMGVTSLKIEGRMKSAGYVGTVTEYYRRAIDGDRLSEKDIENLKSAFDRGGFTDGYFTEKGQMFVFNKPETKYGSQQCSLSEKKRNIRIKAVLKIGQPIEISAECDGYFAVSLGSFICERAIKREVTEADVKKCLIKLGNTPFCCDFPEIYIDEGLMVPLGEINQVRREACEKLYEEILCKRHILQRNPEFANGGYINNKGFLYSVSVENMEQYFACDEAEFVYIPVDVAFKNADSLKEDKRIIISLPPVAHDDRYQRLRQMVKELEKLGFSFFSASNYAHLHSFNCTHADFQLWAFNSETLMCHKDMGLKSCLSPEMNIAQIKDIKSQNPCEAIVYGKMPLMVTKNCFVKNAGNCGVCEMKDRTGAVFGTLCHPDFGYSCVLNSVPVYMGDKMEEFKNTSVDTLRMVFTTESASECRRVIQNVKNGCEFKGEFTRGHYFRGV